jgi:hypothetical protein
MRTTKQQARFAGFLYLLLGLTAPFGLLYVPAKLIVPDNAAATADNLRRGEWLLRLGIASELVHQIIAVFVVLALYELFERVSRRLAVQIVIFGALLSVPIMFANVLNDVAALILVSGAESLSAFPRAELDAWVYLFLQLHRHGIMVASIFWGMWLFPFGLAVIRSRFIPPILGYLLLLAGVGYVVNAFVMVVAPHIEPFVEPVAGVLEMGELPIIFWLLIWGARTPDENQVATS